MKFKYETPFLVQGVPHVSGRRQQVLGKRAGVVDLEMIASADVLPLVSVETSTKVTDFVDVASGGVYAVAGRVEDAAFLAAGANPDVTALLDKIVYGVRHTPWDEWDATYHPKGIAKIINGAPDRGAGALKDVKVEAFAEIDEDGIDDIHHSLGEKLGSYLVVDDILLRPASLPVLTVSMTRWSISIDVSAASCVGMEYGSPDIVAWFPLDRLDDARSLAADLSSSAEQALVEPAFSIAKHGGEAIPFDEYASIVHMATRAVRNAARSHLSALGAERVADEIPFEELTMFRALKAFMASESAESADIEALVAACVESGSPLFQVDRSPANDAIMERWNNRSVRIAPINPSRK
jgi:hypothetical protein